MNYLEVIPESIQLIKMTDSEYFSEKYRDYVSNSKLSLINPDEGGSIEKFREGFPNSYSESFELGSAIHGMLLQLGEFEIPDLRKPTGKLGFFAEKVFEYRSLGLPISESIELASEAADYYKGNLTPKRLKTAIKNSIEFYLGRIKFKEDLVKVPLFLSKPLAEKYEQCMIGISENIKFQKTLYPEGLLANPEVFNEYAILCEVKISGKINKIIKVKAKLDNFTIDDEENIVVLNDLKSTGRPAAWFMGNTIINELGEKVYIPGSFEKYRYYRQVAMYLWLLQNAISAKYGVIYKYKANILLVETVPNFKTRICPIAKRWIDKGLKEFKDLLILASDEY